MLASYNKAQKKDCNTYIDAATTNQTTRDNTCKQYNFTDPTSLKYFMNATWYGDSKSFYYETVQNETELTSAEMTALYDPKTAGSLGEAIVMQTTAIAGKYKCVDATNCTA